MEKLFVSYYRVSTKSQGQSGLGLEAQQSTVLNFIRNNGKLIASYTEIESGKNNQRPALLEAIELSKLKNATLIIAKLDRLSRNVSFIANLMESRVSFQACDIPQATPLTLHIFSAMAEFERSRISQRTREALQAKKRREPDWTPGTNNFTALGSASGRATIQSNIMNDVPTKHAYHFIRPLKASGMSYQAIAEALNDEGYRTRLGCSFHASQVRAIWKRFAGDSEERKEEERKEFSIN